ncbi:uncharacterized protein [Nicotiana sylvestris]|uniref:uncharacterized protein n=1 Tax=Nicotiana sylvestris TaxID=4096 RepID=UPI00388C41D1
MAEYEDCILGIKMAIDMNVQELLVIGDSDLLIHQHLDTNFIDPIPVEIHDQPAYCAHVEEEADGKPWFHDIKEYLITWAYPGLANATQKCTLRRLSRNFFHGGGILYRRTPDLGLLRYEKGACKRAYCDKLTMAIRRLGNGYYRTYRACRIK